MGEIMRTDIPKSLLLPILLTLSIGKVQALPLLQYTISGHISESITGGLSVYNMVGAEFTLVYLLQGNEPPVETDIEEGQVRARYTALRSYGEIFNRPNSANAFQFILHTAPEVETRNFFSPATESDRLLFLRPDRIAEFTIIGTDEFYRFEPGSLYFDFEGQSFFSGTGVAPLPIFEMSQVSSMRGGTSIINGSWYRFTPTSVDVADVAAPSAMFLTLSAIVIMGFSRRGKRLSLANC